MFKMLGAGLLLAAGLGLTTAPAVALQASVTQIEKNSDGTVTYHFSFKTDKGETLAPGEGKSIGDFVTVYNFYGLVDGSVKSPDGWEFSSEEFGRTPIANGYPLVLPLDVPNTPNLTWTAKKAVAADTVVDGFTAITHVGSVVQGEYSAQVTRQAPAVQGAASGTSNASATMSKQAILGMLPMPSFLADVK